MSSTFSEDLWGSIKIVYDRYEEGKNTLGFLISFFKESSTIGEKNSSKIQKLCLKSSNWTEKGSSKGSWDSVKKWHEESFKYNNIVTSQLNTMVVQPLMQIKKDQEFQKGNLAKEVTKLEQNLEKSKDSLNKAKNKYTKSCRDYEFSTLELKKPETENLKPKDLEKLKVKNINDKSTAEASHTAYKQIVQEHRSIQQNYASSMKKILDNFQEMDERRLEVIKEAFQHFYKTQEMLINSYKGEIDGLSNSISSLDYKKDVQDFIDSNKSDNSPEPLVEYEPYHSEHNIDVPADSITTSDSSEPKLKKTKSFTKKDKKVKKSSAGNSEDSQKLKKSKSKVDKKKGKDDGQATEGKDDGQATEGKDDGQATEGKEESSNIQQDDQSHSEPKEDLSKEETQYNNVSEADKQAKVINSSTENSIQTVAISLYDYEKQDDTEITFFSDSLIIVTKKDGEVEDCPGWMEGIFEGNLGLFPANRVQLLTDLRKCKAQFLFEPQNEDELELHEGEEIVIIKEHEKWFYGCNIKGYSGLFPENFVTLL